MTKSQDNKTTKELTPKDKKIAYITLITVLAFFIFWRSVDFSSAIAIVLFFYFAYFIIKALRSKSAKKKNILIAIPFFMLALLIMPQESKQQTEKNNSQSSLTPKMNKQDDTANKKKLKKTETPKPVSWYQVTDVIDGDTIKVSMNDKVETVQLIGIDAPEVINPQKPTQCYGQEAFSRMHHYVRSKKVRLETDTSQGDRNKEGQLLRYVYTENNTNVAQALVKDGVAKEYVGVKPYKQQKSFKKVQVGTKKSKKGLWAKETCNGNIKQTDPKIVKEQQAKKKAESEAAAAELKAKQQRQAQAAQLAEVERQRQAKEAEVAAQARQAAAQPAPVPSTYYQNCAAARAAGAAPVYAGQPGYGSHLDRDSDGVGCE